MLYDCFHLGLVCYKSNEIVVEYLIGRVRVNVRQFVSHNLRHIFPAVLEYQVAPAWVIGEEGCDIVDIGSNSYVARFFAVM